MDANIGCSELKGTIDKRAALVIDVMMPEDYAACHIAGAHNACVYEMVFLERMAELVPDRTTELVVYDLSGTTQTAQNAREKLINAGYRSVSVLSGGLVAWRASGYPVEEGNLGGSAAVSLKDGRYRIDAKNSRLEWIGRNFNNRHNGCIAIAEGELVLLNGLPAEGFIV